jgi:hypothetical protein
MLSFAQYKLFYSFGFQYILKAILSVVFLLALLVLTSIPIQPWESSFLYKRPVSLCLLQSTVFHIEVIDPIFTNSVLYFILHNTFLF